VQYIENTGRNVMFVGGKLIPPGEGRHIDVADTAPELSDARPAPVAAAGPTLAQLIADMLKGNVKSVAAHLPQLTGEALDLVVTIEGADGTPRKSLLDAVAAEQLKRANARLDADQAQAEFEALVQAAYQQQLDALTADELAAIGEEGRTRLMDQARLEMQADLEEGKA
jgi:hypothetical protein